MEHHTIDINTLNAIGIPELSNITGYIEAGEILSALRAGREDHVEVMRGNGITATHFPRQRRGSVCDGGNPEWSDADDMEELLYRYRTGQMTS